MTGKRDLQIIRGDFTAFTQLKWILAANMADHW